MKTSQHVPDDLLQAFVEGEVEEQLSLHIADHLDACPACATRATAAEPLAAAFAAVSDPPMPPGLASPAAIAALVARASEPEALPTREIAVGALLLFLAFAVVVATEGPFGVVAELGSVLAGAAALGRTLPAMTSPFQLSLVLGTGVTLLGSLATLHFAPTPLLDGHEVLRRIR